jgi:hypothetical protein
MQLSKEISFHATFLTISISSPALFNTNFVNGQLFAEF